MGTRIHHFSGRHGATLGDARNEGDLMTGRRNNSPSIRSTLLHMMLFGLALLSVVPFFWLVCAAFKQPKDIFSSAFLPWQDLGSLSFRNFGTLFSSVPFSKWLFNSLFLASTQTVIVVTLSSL